MSMPERKWITCADVSEQLEVSESTPYRWIREGRLPAYRVGDQIRIDPEDVKALVRPTPSFKSRGCGGVK